LLVEVVGCSWDTFWNHSLYGKILAPAVYIFQKIVVRQATYTHYVTQRFLQERYPSRADISLSQSDVVLGKSINKEGHPSLESNNPHLVIGSIGAYNSEYKDFETLFKAIRLVLQKTNITIELQLVGGGDSRQLKRRAAELGVLNSIVFKGSMAHESVLLWLNSLNIYLHPSKAEGCPRSLIEALASNNTLCFGSDVGGIPELLPSSALFPKGDFRRIAMFLELYLNTEWRLNSIAKQEKCFNIEEFKPDVIRNNYLRFYHQVLSEL
jgi:glycosyltransferase involved in cell wall biosynthesis